MPPRDWRLRVEDILEAINRIDTYTRGMTHESFAGDSKTIDAVVRNLEIIGEASSHVEDAIVRAWRPLGQDARTAQRCGTRVLRRGRRDHLAYGKE